MISATCKHISEGPGPDYPYLGYHSNKTYTCVVLFIAPNAGVLLYSTDPSDEIGEYSDKWFENCFISYANPLTTQKILNLGTTIISATGKNLSKVVPKYPCLGQYTNKSYSAIVLFTEPDSGLRLYSTDPLDRIGEYSTDWSERNFVPHNDPFVLQNV